MADPNDKRIEPELKAREEVDRAPGYQDPSGVAPDPSGDEETTEEEHDNPDDTGK